MGNYRAGSRRRRTGLTVLVAGALVVGGGTWAVAEWGTDEGGSAPRSADPQALRTARAFLSHWAAGDLAKAAALTDAPDRAETTLRNFTLGLDVERPSFTAEPGPARQDPGAPLQLGPKLPRRERGARP
ncbi:hypothetical protein AAHZ94_30635 [Streptomyces sp. HSW2009]|uniref:hypothetical protein n=1 Tax=Streptomyces sp. HSW2009 TaxID=3142890 RepID=UPI0032ED7C56